MTDITDASQLDNLTTDTRTGTGVFLPPLTVQSGLPATLVRQSWVTADINTVITSTLQPPATASITTTMKPTSTLPTDSAGNGPQVVVSSGAQLELQSKPTDGGVALSKPLLAIIVGFIALCVIGGIAASTLWCFKAWKRKKISKEEARLRREEEVRQDYIWRNRENATVLADLEPSARRPQPKASNLCSDNRAQGGKFGPAIRFMGVKATPSEAALQAERAAQPMNLDYLNKPRDELMSDTVVSEATEYDAVRRKEVVNDGYRKAWGERAALKRIEGKWDENTGNESLFMEESMADTGEQLFTPKRPEKRIPALPTMTPGLLAPPNPTYLRAENTARRRASASVRQLTPPRSSAGMNSEYMGNESWASDNLSQADFGVDTEVATDFYGTETQVSFDPWREEAERNRREGRRQKEKEERERQSGGDRE